MVVQESIIMNTKEEIITSYFPLVFDIKGFLKVKVLVIVI